MPQYPGGSGGVAVHGPDDREAEGKEGECLNCQIAQMPALELELAGLDAAETDEQHQEKQDGLCPAADGFQNWPGCVDGGYLGVDEIGSGSGDHAYHEHPILKEFEKSAFHIWARIYFYFMIYVLS